MRIPYVIFPIIIISLMIIFSGLISITFGQEIKLQTYENPEIGIRFSVPADWGNIIETSESGCDKQESCILGLEGTNTTYVFGFSLLTLSKEVCLCNSLIEHVKNGFTYDSTSLDGFSFIGENQTTIGKNHSGWQYEYSFLLKGVDAQALKVNAVNDGIYYSLGISYRNESRSEVLPEFRKMIDSIEFFPIESSVSKMPSFMNMNVTGGLSADMIEQILQANFEY